MEWKILDMLAGIAGKLLSLRTARKREVADYLASIALLLHAFGPRYRDGAPEEELRTYVRDTLHTAHQFASAVGDVILEADCKALTAELDRAFNAKELLQRRQQVGEQKLLNDIAEVEAAFRATARSLLATVNKLD